MSRVFMNRKGHFLKFHPVSSHSPETVYCHSWTDNLNSASLARSINVLSKYKWKDNNPVNDILMDIPAAEVRTVSLAKESGG